MSTAPCRRPQRLQLSSLAASPLARLHCRSPWSLPYALPVVLASKSSGCSSFAASPPNHGVASAGIGRCCIYRLGACGHRIRPVRSLEKGGVKFLVEKMEEEGSCSCAATKMATSPATSKRANEEEGGEGSATPLALLHPRIPAPTPARTPPARAQPRWRAKLNSGVSRGPGCGGRFARVDPGPNDHAGNQTTSSCTRTCEPHSMQVTKHA
uniref:Uncharacterized protein n=1 Tax=Oryza glumipatula TaxID=40148 RepID=A0A0D9Y7E5_9ORYZ